MIQNVIKHSRKYKMFIYATLYQYNTKTEDINIIPT